MTIGDFIKKETASIFVLTLAGYTVALFYEMSRYAAFGINIPITLVKPFSFFVSVIVILFLYIFYLFVGRISEGRMAVRYSNALARRFIVDLLQRLVMISILAIAMAVVFNLPTLQASSRVALLTGYTFYFLGGVIALLWIYFSYLVLILPRRCKSRHDYEAAIARRNEFTRNPNGTIESVMKLTMLALFIMLPIGFGMVSPYVAERYDVVSTDDESTRRAVVDVIGGSTLLTKKYDVEHKKFLDGYQLEVIKDQEFKNIILKY